MKTCDHKWEFIRDWMGDPDVINGTIDISHWRCKHCDETSEGKPDDWDDPDELNADDERDKRIDDALCGWDE